MSWVATGSTLPARAKVPVGPELALRRPRTAARRLPLASAMFGLALSVRALATELPNAADGAQDSAQAASQSVAGDAAAHEGSRLKDPVDGQFDVSQVLEHAYGFLPIPLIVTEPAVGYGGGLAGMFVRPRKEAGAEGWSRPDLSAVGGLATENKTWMGFAADASRWLGGRLRTLAAGGVGKINLDFYGAGLGLPEFDQPVRYSLKFSGGLAQANWQLTQKSRWAVGLRYVYARVTPELRDEAAAPLLPVQTGLTVSAPTAILEYDSRDNIFTPTRGLYSETSYLLARTALGSDVDFERFQQILMAWQPLPHDVILAARADYFSSSANTPFYLRPYIALRGVPAMRYQGDQVASVEVEARWQWTGRWSLVPFAGYGATRLSRSLVSGDRQSVGSGGVGIRYELARKFGLHAGLDVAHSPGTTAVYLQIGNAWFRP